MAIFLSYSRHDEKVVKALAQGLESARRQVWLDADLGGGDAWWDKILSSIRSCSASSIPSRQTSVSGVMTPAARSRSSSASETGPCCFPADS